MADEILTPEQINLYRHAAKLDPPFAPAHRLLDALDAIEALRAERDRLAAELGERRMCVNCGRTKPASEDRHEPLPECTGPDGHAACTFDMTPQEAWEHWRAEAHRLRELYSDLIYQVAKKHPGESRHQTAKRYIHERENSAVHQARAALAEAPTPDPTICPACKHPAHAAWECTAAVTIGNSDTGTTGGCACGYEPTPAREEDEAGRPCLYFLDPVNGPQVFYLPAREEGQ